MKTSPIVAFGVVAASSLAFAGASLTSTSAPAEAQTRLAKSSILHGAVLKDGAAVAGATVDLVAWPNTSVLNTIPAGVQVPLRIVGVATTDDAGSYDITGNLNALPTSYFDASGTVDLEAISTAGTQSLTWSLPLTPASDATSPNTAKTATSTAPATTDLNFQFGKTPGVRSGTLTATRSTMVGTKDVLGKDGWTKAAPMPSVSAATYTLHHRKTAIQPDQIIPCGTVGTNHYYYNRPEKFTAIYGWLGAEATITETTSSEHTLGIGLKAYGSSGWSADGSGSMTESTGSTQDRGGIADAWVFNSVTYRDFQEGCAGTVSIRRRPVATSGMLTDFTYAPHKTFSACHRITGGHFTKTQGKNATVGGGMDIIVLDVNAQAGWSTSTSVEYAFTKPTRFCGSDAKLGYVGSPQVEAHRG